MVMAMATTRGRLSPATPLLSLTTPLEAMATTRMVPATPTLIGLPRVFTRGRLPARATSTLTVMMAMTVYQPTMVSVSVATMPMLTRTVLAVLARGPPMATPLLSLTILLEDTATTSMVPAPLTPTGAPRVFTRGRLSPATLLLLLTTPLVATATTSMALATPTLIGLLRVFTRGKPLAPATNRLTVATATATIVRTPNMMLRSMATTARSTRLVMETPLLTTTDSASKAL